MKKFIRLLSFEMNRFLKFLVPTFIIVAAVQLFDIIRISLSYNGMLERVHLSGGSLDNQEPFSVHNITGAGFFELSIVAIVFVFMFYSFYTWYREWLGNNKFIYRLLMLPMNRLYIFLTKALVFLIGGFLAFIFQFGMYGVALMLSELIVPAEHYVAIGIHNVQPPFTFIQSLLFPTTIFEFISTYSFAFGALITLFTAIIMERTYRMKGLVLGVVYFTGYFVLFTIVIALPYTDFLPFLLKPSHGEIITLAYQFLMIGLGILISWPLLNKRIKI
jgi:hypothetical protein